MVTNLNTIRLIITDGRERVERRFAGTVSGAESAAESGEAYTRLGFTVLVTGQ